MAIVRAPFPRLQFKSEDGRLMAFCWLKVFIAGTTTQVRTYKNESGTLNPAEIQLDNRGECDVWIDDDKNYRFELWSVDRKRRIKTYNNVSAGTGSAASHTTDVIKWSDVQNVQDSDYSGFMARIASDIAAGIAPVVLDDVNGGAVAVLDNINAGGALFRTSASCNERDVVFTEYVITDVAVSRTTRTRNILFKNSSNAYGTGPYGFVEVKNNQNGVYTYSGNTGGNSLDFLADFDSDTAVPSVRFSDVNPPNFAVKIVSTAATDGTVTVYKKANGIYTPLKPSVAGGTTVEAGKTYQLTCVGDCWTLAEFEEPTQGMLTKIGGRMYKVVKIGNLYWMAENLDYVWEGLDYPADSTSDTTATANYYDDDSATYGSNGLLYNGIAAETLAGLPALEGWRMPTTDDFIALMTAVGGVDTAGTKLKSTSGWDGTGNGTDDYGFNGKPAGGRYAGPTFNYIGKMGGFWALDENAESISRFNLDYDSTLAAITNNVDYSYGFSIRLVKDA